MSFVAGYAKRSVFGDEQFAKRAAAALQNDAVSEEVSSTVANELIKAEPNLVAVRPILESTVASIVRSGAFQAVFRAGVADLHRAVFSRDHDTVTLTLTDIGATVRGALQAFDPKLASRIPQGTAADLLDEDLPAPVASAVQFSEAAAWLPIALLAGSLLALGAALALSAGRPATVLLIGVTLLFAGVIALVTLRVTEVSILSGIDDQRGRDALSGVWDAFLGDLQTGLLLIAGCGAVIAAAASSVLRPADLRTRLEAAWRVASHQPKRGWLRALRAIALVVLGVALVVRADAFVSLVATLFGLGIAYAGVAELMRMSGAGQTAAPGGRGVIAGSVVVAASVLGAGAIFVGVGGISQESFAIETSGCNGSTDLCDRSYDKVAVPATHNSMSAATNPGWLFAQQERGIADQLRAGVRGLLIDAHYGVETRDGRVKTDLSGLSGGERATYEAELGQDALDSALRIRDRIVNSPTVGEPGVYLCHRFCELGAITIDSAFSDVSEFMEANPNEVLTIVIEDYVPAAEIAAAAKRTGLLGDVYMGPVGDPWPTLQEIVDSGGRIVMMAENNADESEIPWYHPAYSSLVQETPYSFSKPSQLISPNSLEASCEPNRGPASAGVFLVNHWIDTSPAPRPSNAAIVNERDALLARVRQCDRQRDLTANLIAVDFYEEGDVFGAVAKLNGPR